MNSKQKVAILGAGTMGPGIATIYAMHGTKIAMYSRTQKTLDQAKSVLESNLRLFAEENIITQEEVKNAIAFCKLFLYYKNRIKIRRILS